MNLTFIFFALLCFLAAVLALEALYNLWSSKHGQEAQQIEARLSTLEYEDESVNPLEKAVHRGRFPALEHALEGFDAGRRLVRFTRASGVASATSELLLVSVALALIGLLGALVLQRPLLVGLGLGGALAVLPWVVVNSRHFKRSELFDRQFPEALDLMSRALRAGHALPTAIRLCGEEMPAPLGAEFRLLADETNYGVPLNEALQNLAARVPVPDMGYFVVAVMIQRETGGNMSELLDNISALVRQRLKLRGHIRTLSAEGRMSGWVLSALPFVAALGISLLNPAQMEPLWTHPVGRMASGVAMVMIVVGMLWMRRIVRISV